MRTFFRKKERDRRNKCEDDVTFANSVASRSISKTQTGVGFYKLSRSPHDLTAIVVANAKSTARADKYAYCVSVVDRYMPDYQSYLDITTTEEVASVLCELLFYEVDFYSGHIVPLLERALNLVAFGLCKVPDYRHDYDKARSPFLTKCGRALVLNVAIDQRRVLLGGNGVQSLFCDRILQQKANTFAWKLAAVLLSNRECEKLFVAQAVSIAIAIEGEPTEYTLSFLVNAMDHLPPGFYWNEYKEIVVGGF